MEKTKETEKFEKLMKKISKLPEEQKQKVVFFAQGVMAASAGSRKESNE